MRRLPAVLATLALLALAALPAAAVFCDAGMPCCARANAGPLLAKASGMDCCSIEAPRESPQARPSAVAPAATDLPFSVALVPSGVPAPPVAGDDVSGAPAESPPALRGVPIFRLNAALLL